MASLHSSSQLRKILHQITGDFTVFVYTPNKTSVTCVTMFSCKPWAGGELQRIRLF